jgi:hypothetical protein
MANTRDEMKNNFDLPPLVGRGLNNDMDELLKQMVGLAEAELHNDLEQAPVHVAELNFQQSGGVRPVTQRHVQLQLFLLHTGMDHEKPLLAQPWSVS